MNGNRRILTLAMVSVAIVTWRELRAGEVPPPPHVYVGTAIVFGFAHVIAEANERIGTYLAFAWTLWIAYGALGGAERPGARRSGPVRGVAAARPDRAGTPAPKPKARRQAVRSVRRVRG